MLDVFWCKPTREFLLGRKLRRFFVGFVRGVGRGLAGSVLKPVSKFGEAISDMGSGAGFFAKLWPAGFVGGWIRCRPFWWIFFSGFSKGCNFEELDMLDFMFFDCLRFPWTCGLTHKNPIWQGLLNWDTAGRVLIGTGLLMKPQDPATVQGYTRVGWSWSNIIKELPSLKLTPHLKIHGWKRILSVWLSAS